MNYFYQFTWGGNMKTLVARRSSFALAFAACFVLAFTSGCASGGFKLTRQYAKWVNSQGTVLRVVLYILTSVVFAVTLLIDLVINNTMDFWDGKVSAGTYRFEKEGKQYVVQHEILPDSKLRMSTIRVSDRADTVLQEIVLRETLEGEIEMYMDGKLRTKVRHLSEIPVASIYDAEGKLLREELVPERSHLAMAQN